MSSVQALREFINERLTAAAEEIFTVFEQTIVQYEEEIVRQRKLLQITRKSHTKFHRTDLQQDHDCREVELLKTKTNYCEDQEESEPPHVKEEDEEPEPSHVKEEQDPPQIKQEKEDAEPDEVKEVRGQPQPSQLVEHEELGTSHEGEQLFLKFHNFTFAIPSIEDESYLSEQEDAPDTEQFLSRGSEFHAENKQLDSESTMNADLKKIYMNLFHSDRVDNFPVSQKQADGEKLLGHTTGQNIYKKRKLCENLGPVTDKKKIVCEMCGESYNRQSELLVHMRTHTGEKPYSCETCGKSFSQHKNMLVHMMTHTGEKPYSCETCGKSFSVRCNLLRHMRTHTDEKPYSCETCGRSFSQQSHLLRHMRTHTGEKPYSCDTCGKCFSQHSNLVVHMRTHK